MCVWHTLRSGKSLQQELCLITLVNIFRFLYVVTVLFCKIEHCCSVEMDSKIFTFIFAICSSTQTSAEAQKQEHSCRLHANRNGSICCPTLCSGRVHGFHGYDTAGLQGRAVIIHSDKHRPFPWRWIQCWESTNEATHEKHQHHHKGVDLDFLYITIYIVVWLISLIKNL